VTIKRNQSILVALSLFHQDVSSVPVVWWMALIRG
jgi:hypothetical protein